MAKKEAKKEAKKTKKGKPTKETAKKKVQKKKEDGIVEVKFSKAFPDRDINPRTGTRFAPNTSQMMAYDIVREGAKNEAPVKEIQEKLAKTRKENGASRNLDKGYFPFVVATHPEHFEVFRKDEVEYCRLLHDAQPDEKAVAEEDARKAKKKAEREARKKQEAEGKKEKKDKKSKGGKKKVVKKKEGK